MKGGKCNRNALGLIYHGIPCAKKNNKRSVINRRTGRPMVIASKYARENEQDIIWQFKTQRPRTPIPSPVKVTIRYYEPNFMRRDIDNQTSTIMDALTRAGLIVDDSNKHVVNINEVFTAVDKEDPRAVVILKHTKGPKGLK